MYETVRPEQKYKSSSKNGDEVWDVADHNSSI